MVSSTLFAVLAVFSSLVTVNGAVVQRDGTFPTSPTSVSTTPTATTTASVTHTTTASTTPTTTATTATTTPTVSTTPTTTPTAVSTTSTTTKTIPTTTKTTQTTTSTTPTTTPTTTSTSSISVTTTASTTPTKTSSATVPVTTSSTQCPVTVTASATCPPATTTSSTASRTKTATATATATGSPGTVSCDSAQTWQADFAYTAGNQVIFNNQLFTAIQWTFNNAPPAHADQWTLSGTCAQPINNKANCSGVSAWQSTTAYNSGSTVTFNGRLWRSVQWSESNTPGDTSGSWQDLGVCA